jgi:hypothetical protein
VGGSGPSDPRLPPVRPEVAPIDVAIGGGPESASRGRALFRVAPEGYRSRMRTRPPGDTYLHRGSPSIGRRSKLKAPIPELGARWEPSLFVHLLLTCRGRSGQDRSSIRHTECGLSATGRWGQVRPIPRTSGPAIPPATGLDVALDVDREGDGAPGERGPYVGGETPRNSRALASAGTITRPLRSAISRSGEA